MRELFSTDEFVALTQTGSPLNSWPRAVGTCKPATLPLLLAVLAEQTGEAGQPEDQ